MYVAMAPRRDRSQRSRHRRSARLWCELIPRLNISMRGGFGASAWLAPRWRCLDGQLAASGRGIMRPCTPNLARSSCRIAFIAALSISADWARHRAGGQRTAWHLQPCRLRQLSCSDAPSLRARGQRTLGEDKAPRRPAVAKAYAQAALDSDITSGQREPRSFRAPCGAMEDSSYLATGRHLGCFADHCACTRDRRRQGFLVAAGRHAELQADLVHLPPYAWCALRTARTSCTWNAQREDARNSSMKSTTSCRDRP